MADEFQYHASGLNSPARHAAAVTPHDDNDLATVARSLYVGGQGDVTVITAGGEEVTYVAAVGYIYQMVSRVKATGTTATGILAVW